MDPVYLTHPAHGVHVAYHPQEVERCIGEGWEVRGEERRMATEELPIPPGRRTPLRLPRKGAFK